MREQAGVLVMAANLGDLETEALERPEKRGNDLLMHLLVQSAGCTMAATAKCSHVCGVLRCLFQRCAASGRPSRVQHRPRLDMR